MGTAETIAAWGIPRATEVLELAAATGLELAAGATMLEKESGGRNVWGSDGVQTGGAYVKGSAVTRDAYVRYRALQDAGTIGAQGCGPAQLTYPPLQRQADSIGGCWDWRCNVTIGFRHLASLQKQYGVREGFRRYNGSGAAAERYADDAMAKLAKWRTRIGNQQPVTPTPVSPAISKDLSEMPMFSWPAGSGVHKIVCPVGSMSEIVARGWLSLACDGEMSKFDVWFQGDSRGISENHGRLSKDQRVWFDIPDGTTQITVHYVAAGPVGCTVELKAK